jgi:predicted peptidase
MASLSLHRSHSFSSSDGKLPYLVYEPPGWSEEPRPLVLFLHGAGERGTDVERVAKEGLPREIERGKNFPFVTVSPQCPEGRAWVDLTTGLTELLDELVPKLHIDERRIYLTGLSMGAFGAWKLAARTPERFAALVPICGGGDVSSAALLRELPTWAFHGELDDVVPPRHTQKMVDALEAQGAPVKLTIYPGVKHDSWSETYQNPELYEWLLGQRRRDPMAAEHGAEVEARTS